MHGWKLIEFVKHAEKTHRPGMPNKILYVDDDRYILVVNPKNMWTIGGERKYRPLEEILDRTGGNLMIIPYTQARYEEAMSLFPYKETVGDVHYFSGISVYTGELEAPDVMEISDAVYMLQHDGRPSYRGHYGRHDVLFSENTSGP